MMQSLCVIPARSGSKGLKDKNILDLNGMPVIAHTIEACKSSGIFREVYVATDSEEYAEIALKYGAKVPFLEPKEMAEDHVSSTEPLLYFNERLKQRNDLLWCLQPTSPLRLPEDILNAYKKFEENERCAFVVSTTEIDPHYFHWALEDEADGFTKMYFGAKMLVDRSQLTPTVYRPNGAIKVGREKWVVEHRNFFGCSVQRVEMPEERSIHIRSKFDLELCGMLCKKRGGGNESKE